MSESFRESKSSGRIIKVKLDLSNYATKAELKKLMVLIHQSMLKKLI